MSIRITCITKAGGNHEDPHHAITDLGWTNEQSGEQGTSTRLSVYEWIKNSGVAYVIDARGNKVQVGTREHQNGTRYVQTFADGI